MQNYRTLALTTELIVEHCANLTEIEHQRYLDRLSRRLKQARAANISLPLDVESDDPGWGPGDEPECIGEI